jgi:hypothetical protein
VLWCAFEKPRFYQFQETIFFSQPGTRPQDNVELEAITLMDMSGKKATYSWEHGLPKKFPEPEFKPICPMLASNHMFRKMYPDSTL